MGYAVRRVAAVVVMAVSLAAGAATAPTTRPADAGELGAFRFGGKPIHPACVRMLGIELQNTLPSVAAVDVEGCTRNASAAMTQEAEWVRIELEGGGYFEYRHVGVSRSGIHVLETRESGGGTGVFMDLLFVRLTVDALVGGERRQRVILTRLGGFVLGDRDDGVVRLDGDRLTIGRSRHRRSDTSTNLDARDDDRR